MIVIAAYRPWAISVRNRLNAKTTLITNHEDLLQYVITNSDAITAIIFIGWSSIVSKNIIDNHLCICYHPSELPKYRGGSPIQNQIIDGVKSTFGTIFKMNHKIDSGPIIDKAPISLDGDMQTIFSTLEENAYVLISGFIEKLKNGEKLICVEQSEEDATFCKRRTQEMSEITLEDFSTKSAEDLYNKIRCLGDPYPNAFFRAVDGEILFFKAVAIK
jgi:methionyl-tRNA formyltransferase